MIWCCWSVWMPRSAGPKPRWLSCYQIPHSPTPGSLRISSMVLLCVDEGESVEHIAVPSPVRVAADDAHHPEHPGPQSWWRSVGRTDPEIGHQAIDDDAVVSVLLAVGRRSALLNIQSCTASPPRPMGSSGFTSGPLT
jgi:hypothetical protein